MKSYISVISMLLLVATSANASNLTFKKSVNHLLAPVSVVDVIKFDEEAFLKTLQWPERLKGWVSQSQVDEWLESVNISVPNKKWQGIKRVWIDWCFKADTAKFNDFAKNKLVSLVNELGLQFYKLEPVNDVDLPCFEHSVESFKWLNEVSHSPTGVVADVEFKLTDESLVVARISLGYTAMVKAYFMSERSPRHSDADTLILVPKEVVWSGKEITNASDLKGLRLVRTLSADTLLQVNDLEPLPDISVGQRIKVSVENGPITLETKGTAMTAGNVGQKIKIKVEGSRVVNEAKVIAKGVVNVSV
jgi:flagella basal body P-ring formation protein FlgA